MHRQAIERVGQLTKGIDRQIGRQVFVWIAKRALSIAETDQDHRNAGGLRRAHIVGVVTQQDGPFGRSAQFLEQPQNMSRVRLLDLVAVASGHRLEQMAQTKVR